MTDPVVSLTIRFRITKLHKTDADTMGGRTAFVNGTVFVGDGRILESATVLVEGSRIKRVASGNIRLPRDAKAVSLDGHFLFPGFIDCHVHLCLDASADPVSSCATEPLPLTSFKASVMALRTLEAGVTTVRDLGGRAGIDLALRDAVNAGILRGPRILASGQMICMTGGHGWPMGREADGPSEVRRASREQIKAGADVVKLMATGGVLTPGVAPGSPQLTEEELRAGIEEAHKAGRRTATHAMGTEGIINALRAGIDSIEHGVYLNEQCVELMLQKGVTLVPTLSALHYIYTKGREAGIPDYAVEKTEMVRPHHFKSIRMAKEAGVHIAMGTDAGTPFNHHGENLRELELLTQQGFTPMEALIAVTSNAAKALGLESTIGTIEEGKAADLVMVRGNPMEEIGVLTDPNSIVLVVKSGEVVKDVLEQ